VAAAGTMDWGEAVSYPCHAPHRRRLARIFLHRLLTVPVKAERSEPGKIFVSSGDQCWLFLFSSGSILFAQSGSILLTINTCPMVTEDLFKGFLSIF